MESKLYKKTKVGSIVFPRIFNKIGVAMVLASALSTVLCIIYKDRLSNQSWHWIGLTLVDIFIIGLLFFSLAADKIEDERIEMIRLRTLSGSIIFIVVLVIVKPLLYALLDTLSPPAVTDGVDYPILNPQELIIETLFMYNFMFYYLKRKA